MIIDYRRRLVFTLVYIFFKEVTQFSKVLLFPIKKEVRDCTLSWSRKLSDRFKAWGGGGGTLGIFGWGCVAGTLDLKKSYFS